MRSSMPAPLSERPQEPARAHALWRTTQHSRRAFRSALRRAAAVLWLALAAANVSAQISGTASVVSNYRSRGISLSENKPAAQLGIAFDGADGWYTGAFGSTVQFNLSSGRELQAIPFVGYASRAADGSSWDVGADYAVFTGAARVYDYPELYFGVTSENLSGRVYYSSRYFGQDSGAIYAELNSTHILLDRVRLLAHVGILRSTGGANNFGWPARLVDGRVGVAVDLERFNVQLGWVATSSDAAAYRTTGVNSRNGPVLTLTVLF
jgi:uncharacterized protein (TIGR02001 family)